MIDGEGNQAVVGSSQAVISAGDVSVECLKCGSCLSVCPVYQKLLTEMVSPRGKMALAEALYKGTVGPKDVVASYLSYCLMCAACVQECPNELLVDSRIIAARSVVSRHLFSNLPYLAAFRTLLQKRSLMNVLASGARALGRLLCSRVPHWSGLRLRFPLLMPTDRLLPALAREPFLRAVARRNRHAPEAPGQQARFAYFVGCMTNYVYTSVARRIEALMAEQGVVLDVPVQQKCCGMPAIAAGDLSSARRLALHNIDLFLRTGASKVVVTCASCGSALKHYYPMLFAPGSQARARAEQLAARVVDVTELLVDELGLRRFSADCGLLERLGCESAQRKLRVTYHEPCHLVRRMGVSQQPKSLLGSIEGVQFVPLPDADVCCGSGGLFSVHHYRLSLKIATEKARNIISTGADVVATGCPACIAQIRDGLSHLHATIPVVHTIELIGSASTGASQTGSAAN